MWGFAQRLATSPEPKFLLPKSGGGRNPRDFPHGPHGSRHGGAGCAPVPAAACSAFPGQGRKCGKVSAAASRAGLPGPPWQVGPPRAGSWADHVTPSGVPVIKIRATWKLEARTVFPSMAVFFSSSRGLGKRTPGQKCTRGGAPSAHPARPGAGSERDNTHRVGSQIGSSFPDSAAQKCSCGIGGWGPTLSRALRRGLGRQ